MIRIATVFAAFIASAVIAYETYDGYRVLQVTVENADQLAALHKMNNVLGFEVDFWRQTSAIGGTTDMMVAPEHMDKVIAFLADYKIKPKTVVENVAVLIKRTMKEMASGRDYPRDDPNLFALDKYHTYDEIVSYVQSVVAAYPDVTSLITIGNTFEGRPMYAIKIGTPSGQTKPTVFVDAGIHAREWITPATAVYTIQQLTNGSSTTYKSLLDAIDIIIAPSINPDGYAFTWSNTRLWRKTRSGPRQGCYGVDPNRNFPFHWGGAGTSNSPCNDLYRGPSALSEVECSSVRRLIDSILPYTKAYLSLHSYGELILYPYGYSDNPVVNAPNAAELQSLGIQMRDAIRAVQGVTYTVGNTAAVLYAAAGGSDDYARNIGIPLSYTIELSPVGANPGFQLPESRILPTAQGAFAGMMVVFNRVMNDGI